MKAWALLLAALVLVQDAEGERPWDGLLPDPNQSAGTDEKPGSRWLATRILDAETGLPIPGARLLRTPEWIDESALRHDFVMSQGVADADGIARVPAAHHLCHFDCHWLALADGYAPEEEYGPAPPVEMRLRRGIPMSFRVLDPMGRPVAGAVLEFLGGCSHGTAGATATAGPDGVAAFPFLAPGRGQFWVRGPGIASDLVPLPEGQSLGTRPQDLVMGVGRRFEGTVVDLLGVPVPGCVVRAYNEQRGPTAMTGRDGRFVLEGADGASLHFFPAVDLTPDGQERWIDDVVPGIPFTVVATSGGVVRPERTARVVVRARDRDGKPVEDLRYLLVDRDSGRGPDGSTAEEEVEVPPGIYRVLPGSDFDPFTFDPAEIRAEKGKAASIDLAVRARPLLRILGELPAKADLSLAVEGEEIDPDMDEAGQPLPAEGAAVLRVEVPGRPAFFFPVGPAKEGFREVTVALPAARRFPVPAGAKDAVLLSGTREVLQSEEEGALLTDAAGPLVMRWREGKDRVVEAPADRTDGPRRIVPRQVRIRVTGPGADGTTEVFEDYDEEPGYRLVVEREGWRTLRVVAPEAAVEVGWGSAAIRLALETRDGKPADALVLVDGEVYPAPGGILHLRGLESGPHRVVAALRDVVGGGREFRLVLAPGETRERAVTLGEE